jgi:peptide methionine sulfoxide reductase MsrB
MQDGSLRKENCYEPEVWPLVVDAVEQAVAGRMANDHDETMTRSELAYMNTHTRSGHVIREEAHASA